MQLCPGVTVFCDLFCVGIMLCCVECDCVSVVETLPEETDLHLCGDILVSLNPFQRLDIYNNKVQTYIELLL